MSKKGKIKIEFGHPSHGWLSMFFNYNDYNLELQVSNIPVDPMKQLCDALIQLSKGIKEPNDIVWHLEPYCYYLKLMLEDNGYKAIILESESFYGASKIVKEISGSFEEVILPLYRSLKKFYSKKYDVVHWGDVEIKRIEELTILIKEKKYNL